jgi:hypothetical protein
MRGVRLIKRVEQPKPINFEGATELDPKNGGGGKDIAAGGRTGI